MRASNYMTKENLKIFMNAFFTSQFWYCILVWMFHSRTSNSGINKLLGRVLYLVYNNSVSSFSELLIKDNSMMMMIIIIMMMVCCFCWMVDWWKTFMPGPLPNPADQILHGLNLCWIWFQVFLNEVVQ